MADRLDEWSRLYHDEPEVFDRLIRGESIHPDVLSSLPSADRCVEIAAGTGRLTTFLAGTCHRVIAIEPVAAMREILASRVADNVEVRDGTFAETHLPDACADLVVSCSAFVTDERQGGESGLAEMERIVAPGGTIALVWPSDVEWLRERGFSYRSFDGDMAVDFGTLDEALELARRFYPDAVEEIERAGSPRVPYDVIGMNPPRDYAWKTA